jgi:hypothetical protein
MILSIGAGVFSAQASESGPQPSLSKSKAKITPVVLRRLRSYTIYATLALSLLSAVISFLRFPTYDYTPYHPETKSITAGIWTIHFSLDNDMWSSERRMRDIIKELEIDVIGLLESDLQRIIMGNRDTTQFLAEDLGMYVDFGPGPNKHTWGAALLSKFPIVKSEHHLLPSPVGELAPAIHATLDCYGSLVDVFVFHSGQEEDTEDRRLQSEYMAKLMGSVPEGRPAILLSYLVTKPGEGNYNNYVSDVSGMKDIDPSDWDRWCEYILYKNIRRSGYARVSRSTITDTEIQVGKFVVGEPENGAEMIREESVPAGLRFPSMFYGAGVRDHRFHVFDEPRYVSAAIWVTGEVLTMVIGISHDPCMLSKSSLCYCSMADGWACMCIKCVVYEKGVCQHPLFSFFHCCCSRTCCPTCCSSIKPWSCNVLTTCWLCQPTSMALACDDGQMSPNIGTRLYHQSVHHF